MRKYHQQHEHQTIVNKQAPKISKTTHYKRVTKPLLERKRRARINRCLNELKNLIADTLHVEGENVDKLEKADILELTVKHLHCLATAKPSNSVQDAYRFQAGFNQCTREARIFLSDLPGGLENVISNCLFDHLHRCNWCRNSSSGTCFPSVITGDNLSYKKLKSAPSCCNDVKSSIIPRVNRLEVGDCVTNSSSGSPVVSSGHLSARIESESCKRMWRPW